MIRLLMTLTLLLMVGCAEQSSTEPETVNDDTDAPVSLKWAQRTCPYQNKVIDPGLFFDWEGKRIYTCCESCLITVKEKPEEAIANLAQRGEYVLSIEAAKEREAELGPFDYSGLPGLEDIQ